MDVILKLSKLLPESLIEQKAPRLYCSVRLGVSNTASSKVITNGLLYCQTIHSPKPPVVRSEKQKLLFIHHGRRLH